MRIITTLALALSVSGCALFAPGQPNMCEPARIPGSLSCQNGDKNWEAPAPEPPKPDKPEPPKPDKPDRPDKPDKPGHGHHDKDRDGDREHRGHKGRD